MANDGGVVWDGADVEDRSEGLEITQGYAVALNPHVQGQWLVGTRDNGTKLMKQMWKQEFWMEMDSKGSLADHCGRLYASAYWPSLQK